MAQGPGVLIFRALLALFLLAAPASNAAPVEIPDYCGSDSECTSHERAKAANLCQPKPGGAAAWPDDPFDPSIPGVTFYDSFDPQALVERFGPIRKHTERREEHEARDPSGPNPTDSVRFDRHEFAQLAVEAATLQGWAPRVTKLEIENPEVALKCGLRIGMPWQTFQARLGLPDPPQQPCANPQVCPIFYDLYELPFDQGGGVEYGDNSTLALYRDDSGRVVRIVWHKTRWTSGYH